MQYYELYMLQSKQITVLLKTLQVLLTDSAPGARQRQHCWRMQPQPAGSFKQAEAAQPKHQTIESV